MKTLIYFSRQNILISTIMLICLFLDNINFAQTSEKKALLVGIGKYPESGGWASLSSANDLKIVKSSLINQGFKEENIITISDEQGTKKNILEALGLTWMDKLKKSDIAYFHFSGHGQQIADADGDGDEVDGYDECIVPFDSPKKYVPGVYEGQNLITDDELRHSFAKIRKKLGSTGNLIVVLDACHSGTGTRGNPLARGTTEVMASESFVQKNNQKVTQKENNKINDADQNESTIAPMVAFFGSSQSQLNYEMTNDQGEHFGSLSYSFSKYLSQLKPNESYRGMFDKIKVEMGNIAPLQQPQAEGALDMEVMNGKALANAAYFKTTTISANREVTINAGYLHGVFEGSKIGFFAPETRDISSAKPYATGEVIKALPSSSKVKMDSEFDEDQIKTAWVYVTEKSFGKILVPMQISILDPDLSAEIKAGLSKYPFIELDGVNPKLNLIDNPDQTPNSKSLLLRTSEGFDLVKIKIQDGKVDFYGMIKCIKNFAQGMFLRKLELEGTSLNLSLEILKVVKKEGEKGVTLVPFTPDETGTVKIKIDDIIQVRVKNNGLKPAYFSLIDIFPNNDFRIILPDSNNTPEEMKILPEQELTLPSQWTIGEPLGAEIFKLIATDKPLDLKNAFGTRGSVNQSPFEKLFSDTYGDEFYKTRGSNPVSLGSSDINIFTTSFLIVK